MNEIVLTSLQLWELISLIFIIAIAVVLREGVQERYRISPYNKWSELWHRIGLVVRMFLVFVIGYLTKQSLLMQIILCSLATIILWPLYNISCNIGAKKNWKYLRKKGIDGVIRKIFPNINFD